MTTHIERFLKGTDNQVVLTLTEDGQPVDIRIATRIDIDIGPYVNISRTSSEDGVDFSTGDLIITPGDLAEDLTGLPESIIPTSVTVYDIQNTNGARFGGADSDPRLMFSVRPEIA